VIADVQDNGIIHENGKDKNTLQRIVAHVIKNIAFDIKIAKAAEK